MLTKTNIKNIYSLTPMQESMLFHTAYADDTAYIVQSTFKINGVFNYEKLETALNMLVKKYDVFRTIFSSKKSQRPRQVVLKERTVQLGLEDLSHLTTEEADKYVANYRINDRQQRFNLSKDLLIRAIVLKTSDTHFYLVLSFHHIILDGWCVGLVSGELFYLYGLLLEDTPKEAIDKLLNDKNPYQRYIDWLSKQDQQTARNYWKEYLQGIETPSVLPIKKQSGEKIFTPGLHSFLIDKKLAGQIQSIASDLRITVNSFLQTCWGILLSKYNNLNDIVYGTVVSGRPAALPGVEEMVGLFINTIPMRLKLDDQCLFSQVAVQLHNDLMNSQNYDYYSLSEIQALTPMKNNLLNHIFVLENYPLSGRVTNDEEFKIEDVDLVEETSYDLNVVVNPMNEGYNFNFNYNANVYDAPIIEQLGRHYLHIVKQVITCSQQNLAGIELLPEEDKKIIIEQFAVAPASPYPADKSVTDLFKEIVNKYPDNIALQANEKKWTYNELDKVSNQLARTLQAKGVTKGNVVALLMERCPELIISELAILKAGAVYLPIDVKYPSERINEVLQDSGSTFVLLQQEYQEKYENSLPYMLVDELELSEDSSDIINSNNPDDTAYIMYTSGSTGTPKGAMITHTNIIHLVRNTNYLDYSPDRVILQIGAPSFDASTYEVWGALLNGGRLCTITQWEILDTKKLKAKLEEYNIDTVLFTSSLFNQLAGKDISLFKGLKYLLIGGDVVSPKYAGIVRNQYPELSIKNLYGPTENTVVSSYFNIEKDYEDSIPIGYPISHSTCYIVNSNMQLLPVGVTGELCVGGAGVGKGYIGNAVATAEKFIPNPFHPGYLYKTGDLGQWQPDGSILFQGRLDNQIKLRGFRIELADIEQKIMTHPQIKESVVILVTDDSGLKDICAYYTSDVEITPEEIKQYLKEKLPNYMIPRYMMRLEEFPLTLAGKVDRKQLPRPILKQSDIEFIEPENLIEEKIQNIWYKLFNIDPSKSGISTHQDFFEIGGHSLLAMELASSLNNTFGIEVPISAIFSNSTIKSLAGYIIKQEGVSSELSLPKLVSVPVDEPYYNLASNQWVILNNTGGGEEDVTYNVTNIFLFEQKIDVAQMESIIRQIIARHDALRTTFAVVDGKFKQTVHDHMDWSIETEYKDEVSNEELDEMIKYFIRPFNLQTGPLVRVRVVKTNTKDIFMLDVHHVVFDGVSLGLFFKEILLLMGGMPLPPIQIKYRDYIHWQETLLKSDLLEKQRLYWLDILQKPLPDIQFPSDYAADKSGSFAGVRVHFKIEPEMDQIIKEYLAKNSYTMPVMLMAAYMIALHKFTKQEDLLTVTPTAGRRMEEFNDMIGSFYNSISFRCNPTPAKALAEFMNEIRTTWLNAFENQDYPFTPLIQQLELPSANVFETLFKNSFSFFDLQNSGGNLKDYGIDRYPFEYNLARLYILIEIWQLSDSVIFDLEYRTDYFTEQTMLKLGQTIIDICKAISVNDQMKIDEIKFRN